MIQWWYTGRDPPAAFGANVTNTHSATSRLLKLGVVLLPGVTDVTPEWVGASGAEGKEGDDNIAAYVAGALLGMASEVRVIPATITQANDDGSLDDYVPGDRHSYEAHDSGFMMFAVETEGYGAFHAVDSHGREIARTDQIDSFPGDGSEQQVRAAYHQLIDRILDSAGKHDQD